MTSAKEPPEQRLADPAHAFQGFGVGQPSPGAIRAAFGEKGALGRVLRPVLEALGQARGIIAERVRRAGTDRAIRAALQLQIERAQTHLAYARGHAVSSPCDAILKTA